MNRRVFIGAACGAAACARGSRRRLNVYNWSDYVAPDTIPNFEREYGVSVRYGTFESAPEMLAKVMSGNSGWDVVFPSAEYIHPMREMELLAELRQDRLSGLHRLEPQFQRPPWDPDLRWSVPYMHGTTGIAFNRRALGEIGSWADLWNPRLAGRITMLDDPPEVFGAALKKLGRSINSTSETELRAAQREALAQKPLVRAYLNAEVRDQLVSGDVLAAQAWAITAQQAMTGAPDLAFCFPKEGFARFADSAAILRESRRVELAHTFIDYLLRAEVAAAIVKATRTATCNGAARELLDARDRENPVLYPPAEVLARGEWLEPQPAASQRLRDRLWTELKAA